MSHAHSGRSSWPALADLLGSNRRRIAGLAGASLLAGFAEAGLLAIVAQVASALATGSHDINAHLGPIAVSTSVSNVLLIAGSLALMRLALQIPIALIPARITSEVQTSMRSSLFAAFLSASWPTQAADREGRLEELMGNQINQCSQSAVQATLLVTNAGASTVLLISALVLNPAAAGAVVVISVALVALLRPLSAAGKRSATQLSHAQLTHTSGVSEAGRLAEETHVFGVADAQRQRVGALIEDASRHVLRTQFALRILPGTYQSLIYLLLVGGLLVTDRFVSGGLASLGAVVLLLVRAAAYGNTMQNQYQGLKQSLPFVTTVRSADLAYRSSAPPRGTTRLETITDLTFDEVTYAYSPTRTALEGLSFSISFGEAIGVAGPSGGGKSTIAQILLRLREPTSGEYLVNGLPAREFEDAGWHRLAAYVPQAPRLIHASVSDNIKYYRDLPDEAIERAARLAGIHDEILDWPGQYDSVIGPRADAVSGGQAQRICIARAIAAMPKLLVLDEPTSAVDLRSERLIQESLLALKGEVTLVIIAHRISTLDMCDRVMVILDGKIDAFEPYSRLKERSKFYAAVANEGL